MDASSPDARGRPWPVLVRAALAGFALGLILFAAGALILYQTQGVLPAAGGLLATFAAALAAGGWAGAPGARTDAPPTWRWVGAGIAVAVSGAFGTLWAHFGWDRFGGVARALALLFLVGVPVYAIGFLLPGLSTWAAAFRAALEEDDEETRGLPRGAEEVVLAILLGAALGAALGGLLLLPLVSPGPLLFGVALLLTFPLFFPREMPVSPGSGERVLHEEETAYCTLRVTETVFPGGGRQPEMRLYVNEEAESGELERSGAPTFAYIAAAEKWLREITPRGASYLFLGGGAYTLPRRVAEDDSTARVTVVELDPAITRAAYRWFGVRPEHGITTLHGDARAVAAALPAGGWDRVIVDVYGGDEMVPPHLVTREALAEFAALLRPDGLLLINLIGVARGEGQGRFWSTVRTVAESFSSTRLYTHLGRDSGERQNFLLAASPWAGVGFPERAGWFEPWAAEEWPRVDAAAVYRDRAGADEGQAQRAAPREERGARVTPAAD
nr:fused MFS/spermidine synthase [Longimicrobium terrae]